ncbi:MAG: VWA domain-containing protein [Proteobacteria bacterium]|nr:VWA domain-containing protein [Pseudomonadota bacterium]
MPDPSPGLGGQQAHGRAPRYQRHQPETTLLYRIVEQHYPAFLAHLEAEGRALPDYVQQEFTDYLKCGRLEHGFLRVRCESCHHEKLVAFSCKRRGFCPSCGARRMVESAALLVDEVLPAVVIAFILPIHSKARTGRVKMSAAELAEAKKAIKQLRLPIADVPTRRFMRDNRGPKVDMRATLRASLKAGHAIPLRFKRHRRRQLPLVVLCDISGSMNRYSRMFLHFMHAVTNDRDRFHTFVFATRLTNISRHLRHRDVDVALDNVAEAVNDWAGGTRIGTCLKEFNGRWSRRVLGQGAITLIISDGLDRDEAEGLGEQMERLSKSAKRVIWLNPLLRYEGFEARAMGGRAMLPWVDDFRSCHSLGSLGELGGVLGAEVRIRFP